MAEDHDESDPEDVMTLIYGPVVLILAVIAIVTLALFIAHYCPEWV